MSYVRDAARHCIITNKFITSGSAPKPLDREPILPYYLLTYYGTYRLLAYTQKID